MTISFEQYSKTVDLQLLFKRLGVQKPEVLAKNIEHFTVKEAQKRDKIVLGYFGEEGVQRLVEAINKRIETPKLSKNSTVLDVGAGSGFFTTKIAERTPHTKFYAMDATPAMLKLLTKKTPKITAFLGVAENIKASIIEAKAYADIPAKFNAVFSTLMLHHSKEPENVFKSIKDVLVKNGRAIILDLCEHNFIEFKTEMEDIHLGFKPEDIRKEASRYFSDVEIEKIPGIGCSCSGRTADIFVATMHNIK